MIFHISILAHSRHLCVLSWLCLEFPCLVMFCVSFWLCFYQAYSVETLVFLAQSRPLGPFTRCFLTFCKTSVLVAVLCLKNILTASQSHINLIPVSWLASFPAMSHISGCRSLVLSQPNCLVSSLVWQMCLGKYLGKMFWLRHWRLLIGMATFKQLSEKVCAVYG